MVVCVCVRMCANVQVCLVSVCFPVTVCVEIRRMAIRGVCVRELAGRLNDMYTCIYAFKRYDNNKKKADRFILKENEKTG